MKYAIYPLTICAAVLLSGCGSKPAPVYQGPLLCDMVSGPFKWTEAEWQARTPYPENLRRELAINEAWKDGCGG